MIFLIKVGLLIIYTIFVFRIGREYQIQRMIDYIEDQLRKQGYDPDKVEEDE